MLSMYCVCPANRYLGMPPVSSGLAHGLAVFDGQTPTSVRTGQVGEKIQIEEDAHQWRTVWGFGGEAGNEGPDLVRARPV